VKLPRMELNALVPTVTAATMATVTQVPVPVSAQEVTMVSSVNCLQVQVSNADLPAVRMEVTAPQHNPSASVLLNGPVITANILHSATDARVLIPVVTASVIQITTVISLYCVIL
jgi:hypothetical protein